MLEEAYENVAPYLTNLREIKKFVDENNEKSIEEIENLIEQRIKNENPSLATDYKILLNELRKIINTEM